MKTIASQWAEFEAKVIPRNAGATQRQEMRRAFYAGAQVTLALMVEAADASGDNDDVGATLVQRLYDECQLFVFRMRQGRA